MSAYTFIIRTSQQSQYVYSQEVDSDVIKGKTDLTLSQALDDLKATVLADPNVKIVSVTVIPNPA